jgi:hypothetical protein
VFAAALFAGAFAHAQTTTTGAAGLQLRVDVSGAFQILTGAPAWEFAGNVGKPLFNVEATSGEDGAGPYNQISFDYTVDGPRHASIRCYDNRKAVLFTVRYLSEAGNSAPFPVFFRYPRNLGHITFSGMFAHPTFGYFASESPWVFFDPAGASFIISAASNFMTAVTDGIAGSGIYSTISPQIGTLPEGFEHSTLLVVEDGINRAFETWGSTLNALAGVTRPANDADLILSRIGYWTDAGATYYYNNEPSLTYEQTLAAVKSEFDSAGVPLGYMQLDSWFYPKGAASDWKDSSSGIERYTAAPALFHSGLSGLQRALGISLVTHARWIDPSSPYRQQYRISGNVAIDPAYWSDIAGYLAKEGVGGYEQDWLSNDAHTDFNLTDPYAFLDGMAAAMAERGLSMQYCMPTPRHFMQGARYPNLTSVRTSQDRLTPDKWTRFLYASRLGSALGIWPFTDVLMSSETSNLLLAALSAGPVGLGDPLGQVDAGNLRRAARADGVIVKPDAPVAPLDRIYLADSQGHTDSPMVAATFTDLGGVRAWYVFGYDRGSGSPATYTASELGIAGAAYVYDFATGSGHLADAADIVSAEYRDGYFYHVVVPVGPSGMAVIGDTGHFVSMGRKRIPSYADDGAVWLSVEFAAGEKLRTIEGYSPALPGVQAFEGAAAPVLYDPTSGRFRVTVSPGVSGAAARIRIGQRHSHASRR